MINFYFELSSVDDWIIVSLTALGVLIALIGLVFAIVTINKWKNEKKWEIMLEAKAYAQTALEYIDFSYGPNKYILQHYNLEKNNPNIDKKWHNISLINELIEKEHRFLNTYQKAIIILEKLKTVSDNNPNILEDYYNEIIETINDLNSNNQKIRNLEYAIEFEMENAQSRKERIEDFNKRKEILLDKVNQLPKELSDSLTSKLSQVTNFELKKNNFKWRSFLKHRLKFVCNKKAPDSQGLPSN